jgi:ubiquinone/menaquinone biosynthesis C-methylase UbiE
MSFSYSVLQHFSKEDARTSLREMARVTAEGGKLMVQMPNRYGLLRLINRVRSNAGPFRVRYWTPNELRDTVSIFVRWRYSAPSLSKVASPAPRPG